MARRGHRSTRVLSSPVYGRCNISTKTGYRDHDAATHGARKLSRQLLARGVIVKHIHVYTCPGCNLLHLTRMRHYRGGPENRLLLRAAPLDAQLWAMPERHRVRVEAELGVQSVEVLRLPDPIPEPVRQPYANRPRGLRRR